MSQDLTRTDRLRLAKRRTWRRIGQLTTLLCGGILVLLGMTILIEAFAYITNGVITTATVTDWRTEKSSGRSGSKTSYLIEYQFWTEDESRFINAQQSVAADVWNQAKTSRRIQIVYDRYFPYMNEPMVQFTLGSTLFQLALFLGTGFTLVVSSWRGLASPLTNERLLEEIALAEAKQREKQALGLDGSIPEPRDNFANSAIYEVRVYGSNYIRQYEFDDPKRHDH